MLNRTVKGKNGKNRKITDFVYLINSARYHDKLKIFRMISAENKIPVLVELSDYSAITILKQLKDYEIIDLIEASASDDAVELLEHLDKKRRNKILQRLPIKSRRRLVKLLSYSSDTAGGLMQSEIITINEHDSIKEAIYKIQDPRIRIKFNNIYAIGKGGILKGVISLNRLIRTNPKRQIRDIMLKNIVSVHSNVDQEHVAKLFRTYRLYSLPVVDKEKHLLGRITYDDIIDVVEEEIQEDMYKSVGLQGDEDVFDPIKKSVRGRAEWLIINLLTAFLAAGTIALFQNTIKELIILVVFMPVVAGMGGNAGTQTLTVVIRGIALGRLKFKDYSRLIVKEVGLGTINGIITGLIGGIIAYLMGADILIGVVIFLAMIVNLVNAGIVGVLIPLFLKKIGQDPALGSSIILTTFTDVIGFLSYLGIATIFIAVFHMH